MMSTPRCPKCGFPMVIRRTRRGANAGGNFYGCSRYPKCKATIPFESVVTEEEPKKERRPLTETFFPRTLRAREKFKDYQVKFFETVAVPESLLGEINDEDVEEEILKAFSQWRVDFPFGKSESILSDRQRQIISILEKILTRGKITLLSLQLEKEFKEMFLRSLKTEFPLSIVKYLVFKNYQKRSKDLWLDSKEETIFYENILPKFLGGNYEQFVLPQIEISSLLPPGIGAADYQRADFGIFHPELENKIIVEIDGEQHKSHIESDKERDNTLQRYGYAVIRIPAIEIQKGSGPQLSVLQAKLTTKEQDLDDNLISSHKEIIKFIQSIKLGHQIQIVLLQAIQSGFLNLEETGPWHIIGDLDAVGLFNEKESFTILKKSVMDFIKLLENLCNLYSVKIRTGEPCFNFSSDQMAEEIPNAVYISFTDKFLTNLTTFYVQNIYFPFHIVNSSFSAPPVTTGLEKPEEKDLEYFLQYIFRKPNFWEGQYDGILRALQGKDALLLLPTGAGKSLVYQLVSFLLSGRTIIIDPIIALMEDQIDNLSMMGIDRCIAITSQIADTDDRLRAIQLFGQGEYLFAFIAPERFQTVEFRESLRTLTTHTPIALIVVDEAHCVSEWGHDFRTAYLNIGRTGRIYCESNGHIPPLLALTGTASRAVLKDVQRELLIEDFDATITPKSFDRPELKFLIIYSLSKEKTARLKGCIGQMLPNLFNATTSTFYQARGKDTYSGLVFCPHVNGEFGIVRVSDEIRKDLGIPADYYSGKEPKFWNPKEYQLVKHRRTKEFKRNKIPLLICTKAFGMGIDKPNIRYTIHYGIPPSIESFYQEAGRAGRDRRTSYCLILASNDDPKRTEKLLNPNTKVEDVALTIQSIPWEENDDITRVLYFHTNAFKGIDQEKRDVEEVIRHLGDITKKGTRTLTIPSKITERVKKETKRDVFRQAREIVEKALHRLLLIGVISDYTIDYSQDDFTVKLSGATKEEIIETYGKYIESYGDVSKKQIEIEKASQFLHLPLAEFIMEMIDLLLHFIYEVIEKGRRRAISEIFFASIDSPSDSAFRRRILRHLEATEFSEKLEKIITDEKCGITQAKNAFNIIRSSNEAAEFRGQVSRYLESYPDHPALLMLRSLSEISSRDRNTEVTKQNFLASISSALTNYGLNNNVVFEFATWAVLHIGKRDKKLCEELITELLQSYPTRDFARTLIEQLPIMLSEIPAWFLLAKLQYNCKFLISKNGG